MSTKSTMILTTDNEHWYKEGNGRYYENSQTERPVVLEFDPQHKVETDEHGTRVIIEERTQLYEELYRVFFPGTPRI